MKKLNEYAKDLPGYDKTPKAVFAALAYSLAMLLENDNTDSAKRRLIDEWGALYSANIVPQKPLSEESWTEGKF